MTPYKLIAENVKKKKHFTKTISVFPLLSTGSLIRLKHRGGTIAKYVLNVSLKRWKQNKKWKESRKKMIEPKR